jgi:ABC-type glutathione transport system ATPase component
LTDGPTTAPLIEIEHLTKRFGPLTAVDDVSFSVARGEVLGFLGPNGAGKSTTMRMLAGFMPPSSGTARICGHDVQTDGIAARRMLGFLPEGAPTYPDMTAGGFLRFVAKVRGYRRRELDARVAKAVALTIWSWCWRSRSRPCQRASSAASAWRRRCCTTRRCWCWTSRPMASIPTRSARCGR